MVSVGSKIWVASCDGRWMVVLKAGRMEREKNENYVTSPIGFGIPFSPHHGCAAAAERLPFLGL